MQKLQIVKMVVRYAVGTSVGWVTKDIIKNNTDPKKKHQEAEAYIGGAVIGSMASSAAEDWIDKKFDDLESMWNKALGKTPDQDQETPTTEDTPAEVE